jgi:spore photoproduct lyase
MPGFLIEKALVEKEAQRYAFTHEILQRLPGIPVEALENGDSVARPGKSGIGKEILHLLAYQGEFLKPCPGTKEYICCGYQILNVASNCPLDCSYCILQSYFNQPHLRIFTNLNENIKRVLKSIDSHPEKIFRVGTGQFSDSLALDPITRWSDFLLPLFSQRKNAVLELKTKTSNIERLLASKYRDRIVVSWSLNSPYITAREEHKTASLKRRLEAARRCQSEGYILGFHFDPLIRHSKWKEGYLRTLDLLDRHIDPKGIIWISLGSLRFVPELKAVIRKRHPATCVLDVEFIVGLDGKMRYFKPFRIELYSFMRDCLEKWHPGLGLYLCMESNEVWEKTLRWSPGNSAGLRSYLDRRVVEFFG